LPPDPCLATNAIWPCPNIPIAIQIVKVIV